MTTDAHRIKLLKELLAERILVLDGAFGTFVLGENLSAADYGGALRPRRNSKSAQKRFFCRPSRSCHGR